MWTLAALLCLAIGTGANTAAFNFINGVLLKPLPFDEPDQIVMIAIRKPEDRQAGPVSLAQFRDLAVDYAAAKLFQQLAVRTFLPVGVGADEGGPARMVQTEFVSQDYFTLLRLRATVGRFPQNNGAAEAVVSDRLWRTRFHGDASIVGKTVRINGQPIMVSGVAPPGFVGVMQIIAADMWLPVSAYGILSGDGAASDSRREFGLIGRLKPGVSVGRARRELPFALVEEAAGFGVPPAIRPMVVGGSAVLFGLMALLVATAIANVASLMLARATGRQREIALRLALGASTPRIIRQILTECLVLAVCGALLGALLAAIIPTLLSSLAPALPDHISFAIDVRPDWRTVSYASISAILIAVLFGLAPARLAVRMGTSLVRTQSASRTLQAFVIGQVAVTTVLLVTAILLARTYIYTQAVDPGVDIRNTLAVTLDWSQTGRNDIAEGRAFFEQLQARVASMPGVQQTALTQQAPLSSGGGVAVPVTAGTSTFNANSIAITNGYFETVRLPLVLGRPFSASETGIAIVNETMARQLAAPNGSPLGRTFSAGKRTFEVVGVARDTKYRSLVEAPRAVFYEPFAQSYSPQMTLLARTVQDPRSMIEGIRRDIESRNADLSSIEVKTLEDQYRASAAPSKQRAILLAGTCVIGLLLSAFGIFGVVSYSVRQRARELGVRMAIGAKPSDIGTLILRQSLRLAGSGFAIGLLLSLGATRIIASALFGVSTHDPVTLAAVVLILAAVTVAAAYLPARWAMRVDPMLSIRAE